MAQQETDALLIFTADPIADVLSANNSAAWKLNIRRAAGLKYLILARNDAERGASHRAAFVVAKIKDIIPRSEDGVEPDGRWAVTFDQYAEVDVPGAWNKANQYPLTYVCARDVLGSNPEELSFQHAPPKNVDWSYSHRVGRERKSPEQGIGVAEAKRRLAIRFSVAESDIDITIRA